MSEETNLIKSTCKTLDMTYRELGEQIGYSADTLRSVATTGKISEPLQKAIELYMQNIELQKELEKTNVLKSIIRDFAKE